MQNSKKIKQLKSNLPRGAKKIIANKTGLAYGTVCAYLNGRKVSFETESKIITEIAIIIDLTKKVNEAKEALLNYEV
ncbi:hypothetical protein [Flavobacterium oreochromis]|uniref:hypothetical protein n=1 Tax=Flavobacterium oreochromis TaxID=2906078 RepID=UPI00386A5A90